MKQANEKAEFDAGLDWAAREIMMLGADPEKMRQDLAGCFTNSQFDIGALLAIELSRPDGWQSGM